MSLDLIQTRFLPALKTDDLDSFFAYSEDVFKDFLIHYEKFLSKNPDNIEMQKTMAFYEECKRIESKPMPGHPNMENDLRRSKELSNKCKESELYSQNLYACLCGNSFVNGGKVWSCGWRRAGDIVAHMREIGSYLDWHCSGMREEEGFLPEGHISEEIRSDLKSLGWFVN